MRFSERRNHRQNLIWADQVEGGEFEDAYGIVGKSVFFKLPYFDIVWDILPESMHLLDGGFMKNTCGRTFMSGTSAQTRQGYRRTNVGVLSDLIK